MMMALFLTTSLGKKLLYRQLDALVLLRTMKVSCVTLI